MYQSQKNTILHTFAQLLRAVFILTIVQDANYKKHFDQRIAVFENFCLS